MHRKERRECLFIAGAFYFDLPRVSWQEQAPLCIRHEISKERSFTSGETILSVMLSRDAQALKDDRNSFKALLLCRNQSW